MEHKFKIGDKVRVVKIKDDINGQANKYLNKTGIVTGYFEEYYKLDLDNDAFDWYEEELELIEQNIIDKIKSAIIEAAKNAPIIVEQTEDGGIKISPIEDDLPIDTPVICSTAIGINIGDWNLRYYAGKYKCFIMGNKSTSNSPLSKQAWDYIIPCDKFNFENPEESLKYNIVK